MHGNCVRNDHMNMNMITEKRKKVHPFYFTFIFDILQCLPVHKLDNVTASQRFVDNLQHHAGKCRWAPF
jgi:hypothetical protein